MDLARESLVARLLERFDEFKNFEQLNNSAVDSKWRDILTSEANSVQLASIAKIRANYTKQLDRCDAVIQRLFQWIRDGESQYQFSVRAHKRNLELFSNLTHRRLDQAFDRFRGVLDGLKREFNANRSAALSGYRCHVAEVRDITCAIEHGYQLSSDNLDERFRAVRDGLMQRLQEATSALRTHLTEETNKSLEAQKRADDQFKGKSEGKTQQYLQMAAKDREQKRQMKQQEVQITNNAATIAHWRRKLRNNERESRDGNERLRQEKESLSLHFRELKATMAHFRSIEGRKLAEISVAFDSAINALTDKLKLAEKILKYAEVGRKLETEREQVLPFPKAMSETDPEMISQIQQFKIQVRGDPKYLAESDLFDRFYRRFNNALLQKLALQREKEALAHYNLRLRNMLKKYIGGMGVSATTIDKPNTLFIVNQITNAPMRKVEQGTIPQIDAAMIIASVQLQGHPS
jgi:hypothetical protein